MDDKNQLLEVLSELHKKAMKGELSDSDKAFVQNQCELILRRKMVKYCDNSYHDTVVEMTLKLKNIETMEQLKKSNYLLKNGVILQNVVARDPNIYTNANLTDSVAEEYLRQEPKRIVKFAAHPEDWHERIKKLPEPKPEPKKDEKPANQKPDERVAKLEGELATANKRATEFETALKTEKEGAATRIQELETKLKMDTEAAILKVEELEEKLKKEVEEKEAREAEINTANETTSSKIEALEAELKAAREETQTKVAELEAANSKTKEVEEKLATANKQIAELIAKLKQKEGI